MHYVVLNIPNGGLHCNANGTLVNQFGHPVLVTNLNVTETRKTAEARSAALAAKWPGHRFPVIEVEGIEVKP